MVQLHDRGVQCLGIGRFTVLSSRLGQQLGEVSHFRCKIVEHLALRSQARGVQVQIALERNVRSFQVVDPGECRLFASPNQAQLTLRLTLQGIMKCTLAQGSRWSLRKRARRTWRAVGRRRRRGWAALHARMGGGAKRHRCGGWWRGARGDTGMARKMDCAGAGGVVLRGVEPRRHIRILKCARCGDDEPRSYNLQTSSVAVSEAPRVVARRPRPARRCFESASQHPLSCSIPI